MYYFTIILPYLYTTMILHFIPPLFYSTILLSYKTAPPPRYYGFGFVSEHVVLWWEYYFTTLRLYYYTIIYNYPPRYYYLVLLLYYFHLKHRYYGFGFVSEHDTLWWEYFSGRMQPKMIKRDGVHPTDLGPPVVSQ